MVVNVTSDAAPVTVPLIFPYILLNLRLDEPKFIDPFTVGSKLEPTDNPPLADNVVKAPVEALVAPIAVPSIAPPLIST